MPAGRPTKYKREYDEQAYKLCLLNATDKQIADFFGVAEQTINEWKHKHKKFSESIRAGKIKADMEISKSLFERASGAKYKQQRAFKVKEVIYGDNGKRVAERERLETIDVDMQDPPDTKAIEFWLKNRQPGLWRDRQKEEQTENLTEGFKAIASAIMGNDEESSE